MPGSQILWRGWSGLLALCVLLLVAGCAGPLAKPTPNLRIRPEASSAPTAGVLPTASPDPALPMTAMDFLALADRTGPVFTPPRGSALRASLMDAARTALRTKSVFVVHDLTTTGEVTEGVIEPMGSGKFYRLTWVLWKGTWTVVICNAVGDATPLSLGVSASPIKKRTSSKKNKDAERLAAQQLAVARGAWDVYNAKYQAEYEVRLSTLNAVLADHGNYSGTSADMQRAKIPAQMAADGWPPPGPRP